MNVINKNIKVKISHITLYGYLALLIVSAFHYHNFNFKNQYAYDNGTHEVVTQNIDKCIICHFNSAAYDISSVVIVNSESVPQFYFVKEHNQIINQTKSLLLSEDLPSFIPDKTKLRFKHGLIFHRDNNRIFLMLLFFEINV